VCVCVCGWCSSNRSIACVRCKTQVVPVRMDPVRDRRLQGRDTLVSQLWCHGRPTQQAGRHGWRLRTIRARQVLPVLSTRPAGAVPRFCEHCSSILLFSTKCSKLRVYYIELSSRGQRRDDMPPAMAVRTRQIYSTSVRGRVCSLHMAKLQAASVPIA